MSKRTMPFRARVSKKLISLVGIGFAGVANLTAQNSMPWDSGLQEVADALTGTTAMIIGTILIVGAGLTIAWTEGQGLKKLMWVIVGTGIAVMAPTLLEQLGIFSIGT
jgi:type IV secretory pathway VirB2 component (pilin)